MPTQPRNYWIVGASTGIGRALALDLLARGDRVAISARSVEKLNAIASEAGAGERCLVVVCDVTDDASVASAFENVSAAFGQIEVAVLNAGTYTPDKERTPTLAGYRQVFDVNVLGIVRLLEHLVPHMQRARSGHIAMTSSLTGYVGLPHAAAYSATKAALISMAESLHTELASSGVLVSVINPGFVKTPMTDRNDFPMPFLMSPEAASAVIVRGLDRRRFEVRFPWQTATLMRFLRLLPYGLYFRIARHFVRHV